MIVKIRLLKTGRKRVNTFRIIVIDSEFPRDSLRYLANIGYYLPQNKKEYLSISTEMYEKWIKNGAQPTDRVKKLYKIAKENSKYVANQK